MNRILIVEDVPALHEQYSYDLNRLGGYETVTAATGGEALRKVEEERFDCIILDLELPGVDGFEVLKTLQSDRIDVPVIVYTGTGNYDRCVRAVKLGAFSFIDKAEPIERVVREVENALERTRLRREVSSLRNRLGGETPLLGSSPVMNTLREKIARVAPVPSALLIVGESGSGKELVAREVHRLGRNGDGPFLAVNSAALPDNLVESELFGHERGAFTGADRLRKGAFEAASGGTLFLDEVGELPAAAQAKLLRVLEESTVTRVGSNRPISVETRVVAATNRDLDAEVDAKQFRRDLLYRLNVHQIRVPPLREHLDDVPELVEHFLTVTCERFHMRRKEIAPEVTADLARCRWEKNNVRELRNMVERLVIASDGDRIERRDIPDTFAAGAKKRALTAEGSFLERKKNAEKQIIEEALEQNQWHITRTAQALGLADHSSLHKIMKRHGIRNRRRSS